jgi:hypothetical protein
VEYEQNEAGVERSNALYALVLIRHVRSLS